MRPHFIITADDPARPYMLRWYVIPRNPWFNIYLHKILRSDDARALHDHPWPNCSILLCGQYTEITATGEALVRRPGSIVLRSATMSHRLCVEPGEHAWSLFLTGPKMREWGFHCPQGWRHWREFVSTGDTGAIGPGCD